MTENRLGKRIEVNFPVSIYEAVNHAKIASGSMFNLSTNGMGIIADISMGVGSTLLLEFKLPKYANLEISIKSKVEVRWQSAPETFVHYGVRFVSLDPVTKSRLRNFIETELKKRKYTL